MAVVGMMQCCSDLTAMSYYCAYRFSTQIVGSSIDTPLVRDEHSLIQKLKSFAEKGGRKDSVRWVRNCAGLDGGS